MFIPNITKDMEKKILKKNTKSTANVILENLENAKVEEVLIDLYIKTNDENSRELVKLYEKQIVLALMDKDKFKEQLYSFYVNTAKYIKKNNLYSDFLLFFHNVYKTKYFDFRGDYTNLQIAYMSLLMEQFCYFTDYKHRLVGVSTKGKPILIREPYLYLDYPIIENPNTLEKNFALYRKLGFDVKNMEDIFALTSNYRFISNTLALISCFIDENNQDILADEYAMLVRGLELPLVYYKNHDIHDLVMNRRRLLKQNKLLATVDFGVVKQVEIVEKFINDELYLIIKYTLKDNTSFNAFYDILNDFFWLPFSENKTMPVINMCRALEILIKELYLIKTADLPIENTHLDEFNYKFIEKEYTFNSTDKKYNRSKEYINEVKHIEAFTRRLPNGAKASEQAIEEAKKFGINLNSDETFVKPFQKNVYKIR